MRSSGERFECPFEKCGGFYLIQSNGLLPVHMVRGSGLNCPGGGFDTKANRQAELAKMETRRRAMGGR